MPQPLRRIGAATLAIGLSLSLAACGGDDEKSMPTGDSTPAGVTSQSVDPAAGATAQATPSSQFEEGTLAHARSLPESEQKDRKIYKFAADDPTFELDDGDFSVGYHKDWKKVTQTNEKATFVLPDGGMASVNFINKTDPMFKVDRFSKASKQGRYHSGGISTPAGWEKACDASRAAMAADFSKVLINQDMQRGERNIKGSNKPSCTVRVVGVLAKNVAGPDGVTLKAGDTVQSLHYEYAYVPEGYGKGRHLTVTSTRPAKDTMLKEFPEFRVGGATYFGDPDVEEHLIFAGGQAVISMGKQK